MERPPGGQFYQAKTHPTWSVIACLAELTMVPVRVLVHPRPGDVPWTRFLPSEKVFTYLLYYFSMRIYVVCTWH
jgi:hypothetical protein